MRVQSVVAGTVGALIVAAVILTHTSHTAQVVQLYKATFNKTDALPQQLFQSNPRNICTKHERIERLHHACQNTSKENRTLTDDQLYTVALNTFVDMKHKLITCLTPKAGCTTWKAILANNSLDKPLADDYPIVKLHYGGLKDFNIKRLVEFNMTMRHSLLNDDSYFKFLVVRHPFDRVHSAYVNKFVSNSDEAFRKAKGSQILKIFRANVSKAELDTGKGVTFQEFVRFILDPKVSDQHWDPVENLCQPCGINYNQVIKTESLDSDNNEIIREHLGPYHRGLDTALNVALGTSNALLSPTGHPMAQYQDLPVENITALVKKYQSDLDNFGYDWRLSSNRTMYTSCRHGAWDRDRVCC